MIVSNSSLIPRPETIMGWAPIMALNDPTALAALDQTLLTNGFVLGLSMPADVLQWWKLRALAVSEVAVAGAVVLCTTDNTRCWVRIE